MADYPFSKETGLFSFSFEAIALPQKLHQKQRLFTQDYGLGRLQDM